MTHGFWGHASEDDPTRTPEVKPLVNRAGGR